jgi:NADP-reducing hydrogenase subunit HndB
MKAGAADPAEMPAGGRRDVGAIKSIQDLQRIRAEAQEKRRAKSTEGRAQITVFMGTCGIAAGARDAMRAILEVIEAEKLEGIVVRQTGCIGQCTWEPLVEVAVKDASPVRYGRVSRERALRIMHEHVAGGTPVAEYEIPVPGQGSGS